MANAFLTSGPMAHLLQALQQREQQPPAPAALADTPPLQPGSRTALHSTKAMESGSEASSVADPMASPASLHPLHHVSALVSGSGFWRHMARPVHATTGLGTPSFALPYRVQHLVDPAPQPPHSTRLQPDWAHPSPAVRVLCCPKSRAMPGGFVIAGRMEDVCAELDRLVALEAMH